MPKKFLDQNGLEYFARKFNDYPDNEILGTVITAIGEELDGKSDVGHTHTAAEVGALPSTTVIPTSTSDLINDSGYLTSYTETDPTVPAWAKATNKPTYTAAEVGALPDTYAAPVTSVNEETGNVIISKIKTTASSNNVEYNLMGTSNNNNTMAVSPYNQDLLSFAKTTNESRLTIGSTATPGKVRLYSSANSASGYTELKSNASSTNTREISFPDATGTVALTTDIPNVPSWALAASKPSYTFSELTSHPTTLNDYGITNAYTKTEVDGLVSGVLHYKGTKATVSALPSSGNVTGDVWHITADGSEWAWDGSAWQELGTAVDLSGYLQTGDIASWAKAANKPTYTASEVGALSSSTTYVSTFNGQSGAITYTAPVTSVNGRTGAVTVSEYDDTVLAGRVSALEQIPWVTYYTGSNEPSNNSGNNGDIYLQTE